MPVSGDHKAWIPAACGSISRSRSGPTISRPATPLATPAIIKGLQPTKFRFVGGDDYLAALLVLDLVFFAEPEKLANPRDAKLGLEGAGTVVYPRVNDAAVVPCLVGGQPALLLQHGNGATVELGPRDA